MIRKDISSEMDLDVVDGFLHDAILEPKDIKYDKHAKTLDLIFYRVLSLAESIAQKKKFLFIFTILDYPIVKSLLHLDNIDFFDIYTPETDAKKFYFVCTIKEGNHFVTDFTPTLEIKFSFKDEIKGYLQDIKILSPSEAKNYRFWELKCCGISIFTS